jgi:hypothetical protein
MRAELAKGKSYGASAWHCANAFSLRINVSPGKQLGFRVDTGGFRKLKPSLQGNDVHRPWRNRYHNWQG